MSCVGHRLDLSRLGWFRAGANRLPTPCSSTTLHLRIIDFAPARAPRLGIDPERDDQSTEDTLRTIPSPDMTTPGPATCRSGSLPTSEVTALAVKRGAARLGEARSGLRVSGLLVSCVLTRMTRHRTRQQFECGC